MAVGKTSVGKANKKAKPKKAFKGQNKFGYEKPSMAVRILSKDWPLAVLYKKASRLLDRHNSSVAVK